MSTKELREFKPEEFVLLREDKVLGNKYGQCAKGLTTEMKEFWLVYGDKLPSEHKNPMPCHEDTQTVKKLDEMIKLTDNLLNLLKEENKKKEDDRNRN
jgi:hypothetical protein